MEALPRSILDCIDEDGEVDMEMVLFVQRSQMQQMDELDEWAALLAEEEEAEAKESAAETKSVATSRSKRSVKKHNTLLYRDTDGTVKPLTWDKSLWYLNYIENPRPNDSKWNDKFRKRFRMPFEAFIELGIIAEASPKFERWKKKDAVGQRAAPTRLMLLGALRYIGRGWTFDNIEEATAIHEETYRQFFHVFIEWGSSVLFDEWVVPPETNEDLVEHTAEFSMAGFNGCIGSVDATHVSMERCSHWLWQSNKGFKLNMPSQTYNITVNHRRRIISSTTGHPARWNDKTLQLFDEFLVALQHQGALDDNVFWLWEHETADESTPPKMISYKGAWLMCDNGYLNWPTLIPPSKDWKHIRDTRFAQWLESMQKDVECTFGIMKGRFRILKAGVRVHGVEAVDRIWRTCCALHNYLLEKDGLDERWEDGALSIWETEEFGGNEQAVFDRSFAIERLMNPQEYVRFDSSRMGTGTDVAQDLNDEETDISPLQHNSGKVYGRWETDSDGFRVVRELDWSYFRERLIEHFHIMFTLNQVKWPNRNRVSNSSI